YNEAHGITPSQVTKAITDLSGGLYAQGSTALPMAAEGEEDPLLSKQELQKLIAEAQADMSAAAGEMEFERAAQFRDRLLLLKDMDLGLKPPVRASLAQGAPSAAGKSPARKKG